jgi:L-ascorbate metabolism protein UlaG (beta-lactamase superfamily)
MNVTYYGHSCFSVEVSGKLLLFDPFISKNELAKNIDPSRLEPDFILISHGHFDHVDDAVGIAKQSGAGIIANFEVATWMGNQGIANVHPMNTGGAHGFPFGRVKLTPAIHSSSFPDGSYAGNPVGFVIESTAGSFYYSGDTALTLDMKLIGETTKLAFAILPIGDNFTMGVDDAIKASDFVGCKKVLGVHYDTFPVIKLKHDDAREKFAAAGKELILLDIGGSADLLRW